MDHRFREHIEIAQLRAAFVEEVPTGTLLLAVRSLTLLVSQTGLNQLARHLVPDQPVEVRVEQSDGGTTGAVLDVRAKRFGLTASVRVTISVAESSPGTVSIDLAPGSRWSPLDQTMLAIVLNQLRSHVAARSELKQAGSARFRLDLRELIQGRIAGSGAPVRWDTALTGIAAGDGGIEFDFTQGQIGDAP